MWQANRCCSEKITWGYGLHCVRHILAESLLLTWKKVGVFLELNMALVAHSFSLFNSLSSTSTKISTWCYYRLLLYPLLKKCLQTRGRTPTIKKYLLLPGVRAREKVWLSFFFNGSHKTDFYTARIEPKLCSTHVNRTPRTTAACSCRKLLMWRDHQQDEASITEVRSN